MANENLGPAEKILQAVLGYTDHCYHNRPGIVIPDTNSTVGVEWRPVTHIVEDGDKVVYKFSEE